MHPYNWTRHWRVGGMEGVDHYILCNGKLVDKHLSCKMDGGWIDTYNVEEHVSYRREGGRIIMYR